MRYGRHRSPCALRLTIELETNRACSRHTDTAPMGRTGPCIDVELRVQRPPDKLQINAEMPAAAHRSLHNFEILELAGHVASQRSHTSQPEAKNTHRSKLPVAGHDIWPHERARGGARWLEAHRVRKARPRHGLALPTARTYVWDIILMVGCNRRAYT